LCRYSAVDAACADCDFLRLTLRGKAKVRGCTLNPKP
jgi:hypothetical protein